MSVWAYRAALFLSATLLFAVQLIFGKMVVPLLGGTPAVWNTCILFSQTALLAGYGYAHLLDARWTVKRQAIVHVAVLLLVGLTLPIAIPASAAPDSRSPILSLIGLMIATVGPTLGLLSATSPMLQAWFARSAGAGANPYPLYAASNLGSMLILLAYPVLIEPNFTLRQQSAMWSAGYLALMGLIATCAWMARGGVNRAAGSARPDRLDRAASWRERLWWVALAAAPASLVLGVTTYITTDVAAVPLLWVIPLAVYLLTFAITFASKPVIPHRISLALQPIVVLLWLITMVVALPVPSWARFAQHIVLLFATAMVCHGELVRRRPQGARLTEFYLWLAVGGVLGGAFNAVIAPVVFSSVLEYPAALAAACFLRPSGTTPARRLAKSLDVLLPIAVAILVFAAITVPRIAALVRRPSGSAIVALALTLLILSSVGRRLRYGLLVSAVVAARLTANETLDERIMRARSFFGVYTVRQASGSNYRSLAHGTTIHGGQLITRARARPEPLTYYHRRGPLGQLFAALDSAGRVHTVAAIGLGVGSVSCYARPGERWAYYEIDPLVKRIAFNPRYFTYVRDCLPNVAVILGDARVSLRSAPRDYYDLVIVDAFTSDAIPVHLLTREALELLMSRASSQGIVAFHISNRLLDLEPVLAANTEELGLVALAQSWRAERGSDTGRLYASTWVVVARRAMDLAPLGKDRRWKALERRADVRAWTDDYSDIVRIFKWRRD